VSDIDVLLRIEASMQDGGWRANGSVINEADRLDFYQELEIWYDLYAGAWEGLPRAAFAGHLLPEPWEKTVQSSRAPWAAYTAQEFMKRGKIQGIFFKDVAVPANQHQINGMTYASIVEHILGQAGEYGHCNLVAGVWPEGIITLDIDSANSSEVDEYEVKEGNFWQRLVEIAEIDRYLIYMSKDNVLHYVPHPMFGASLPTPVFTLGSDWLAEPLRIERRNVEQIGQVKLHGVTPRGLQLLGKYPTNAEPGPIIEKSGYVATSNALMNTIAERMYKFENRDYTVEARIGSGLGLLVELLDRVQITYTSAADGLTWSAKKFWVHGIAVEILANFMARTTLTLEAENA
jgi:hypothetical protein